MSEIEQPNDDFDPRAFLEEYFASIWELAEGGAEALREWEVEDVKWETPWSDIRPGWNSIDEHAQVLSALAGSLTSYTLTFTRFHRMEDPEWFVIEAEGGGPHVDGTREYRNEYVLFIRLRDRKIAEVREYYNPLKLRDLRG